MDKKYVIKCGAMYYTGKHTYEGEAYSYYDHELTNAKKWKRRKAAEKYVPIIMKNTNGIHEQNTLVIEEINE